MEKMNRKEKQHTILFIVAIVVLLIYVFPLLLILLNSFKSRIDIIKAPMALPSTWEFRNYVEAFERMNYARSFMNSLMITVIANAVLIVFAGMLAYYLERFTYKFNKIILSILIASMIIPFQALMIPFVSIYGGFGLLNSRLMLVFFYLGFGISLSTFMYTGYLKNVPKAMDESALVEGATKVQTFRLIVFPMLKPITATIVIMNSLWVWNDFLLPSLVLYQDSRTLPLMTFSFFGKYTSQFGLAMAGLVLSIIPIVILYLFLQKQIISGITSGAVK